MNNSAIKRYMKAALKHCPAAYKKQLSVNLNDSLLEFADRNPDFCKEMLINHFGAPERYAEEYIANLDDSIKFNKLTKNKFIKRLIFVAIATLLIIITTATTIIVIDSLKSSSHYYEVTIDEYQ